MSPYYIAQCPSDLQGLIGAEMRGFGWDTMFMISVGPPDLVDGTEQRARGLGCDVCYPYTQAPWLSLKGKLRTLTEIQ